MKTKNDNTTASGTWVVISSLPLSQPCLRLAEHTSILSIFESSFGSGFEGMDADSGPAGRVQSSSLDSEYMRGQNSTRQEHDHDDHHTITSRPAAAAPFLVVVAKLAAFTVSETLHQK
jgi:hypothetical protein